MSLILGACKWRAYNDYTLPVLYTVTRALITSLVWYPTCSSRKKVRQRNAKISRIVCFLF